jgi:hypothetical protein
LELLKEGAFERRVPHGHSLRRQFPIPNPTNGKRRSDSLG